MGAWFRPFHYSAHKLKAQVCSAEGNGFPELREVTQQPAANTNSALSLSNIAESQGLKIYVFNEAAHIPSNLSQFKRHFC